MSKVSNQAMSLNEPLQYVHPNRWKDLQKTFKNNWPKNISGYYTLERQQKFIELGLDYGFKVFCPFGNLEDGMVALNEKGGFYEIVIQSGNEDTSKLEEALINTSLINWDRQVVVPYAPHHVMGCLHRVLSTIGIEIDFLSECNSFIIHKNGKPFTDIELPNDVYFDKVKQTHVDIVNSEWPYRYQNSEWYFSKLIEIGPSYGIFQDSKLASWVFINEGGSLCNLFTLDKYRRKGYAEIILRTAANDLMANGKDTFAFCSHGNTQASNLYRKLGFEEFSGVTWCFTKPRSNK